MTHLSSAMMERIAAITQLVPGEGHIQATRGNLESAGSGLTDAELQFGQAVDFYKRHHNRPYPNYSEILAVLLCLGYEKVKEEE